MEQPAFRYKSGEAPHAGYRDPKKRHMQRKVNHILLKIETDENIHDLRGIVKERNTVKGN